MNLSIRKRTLVAYVPIVGLLLLYVLSRTYHLMALPPFLDESEVIQYGQDAYRGNLLTGADNGRLAAGWWVALFQASGDPAAWLNRIAVILFSLISVAVVYNTAAHFTARFEPAFAGVLTVILYILMPFSLFHERLGLTDPYTSVFGALILWFAVRFAVRGRIFDALLAGLMVTAAIIAKATGIMLAVVPAIIFVILIPLSRRRQMFRGLFAAYAAFALTWVPFYLYLRSLGLNYFRVATTIVGTNEVGGVLERVLNNLNQVWMMENAYLSLPFVLLAVIITAYLIARRSRIGLALALCILLPVFGLLVFGTKLSGRYVMFHLPPLAICVGVGLSILVDDVRRHQRLASPVAKAIPLTLIAIWAILVALPFAVAMYSDPARQSIPANDQYEYFEHDASGFGIDQAASYLIAKQAGQQKPIHIIGILANCRSLKWQIPARSGIVVVCPPIDLDGNQQAEYAALLTQQAFEAISNHYDLWFIHEIWPLVSLEGILIPYQEVISFERPGNVTHVTLYHVRTG